VKKKLLFFGAYPPPYGGIASHLYYLLPQLVMNGYDVVSLTLSQNEKIIKSQGMKNIFMSKSKFFRNNVFHVIVSFLRSLRYRNNIKYRDFIRIVNLSCLVDDVSKEEETRVMFVYENHNGTVIPILREYFKVTYQIAFMIFGDFYTRPEYYRNTSNYYRRIFLGTDVILSSSQYCADAISNIFGFEFSVEVIYVGVDHNLYAPANSSNPIHSRLNIPARAKILLFMGRMNKEMGLDFLLNNALSLLDLDKHIILIIAGAIGEMSHEVELMASTNDRIKFCPDVSFDDKVNYYNLCDIVVTPTLEKRACMGVAIKEAMSCAKPVIASGSGGIGEAIVDGINGYIVPIQNGEIAKEVFFKRIVYLINNQSDRERMGRNGRKKVLSSFTNEQSSKKYIDILNGWSDDI
jgi:glycosyltransferase involved in cell wall biosynthesis